MMFLLATLGDRSAHYIRDFLQSASPSSFPSSSDLQAFVEKLEQEMLEEYECTELDGGNEAVPRRPG